jgi:co-chaperonin GroES (HSP10)|tara:strand:- start:216 stop:473 length:258 start_codon:yes stop_codon:yes gene_type:complete
MKPVNKYIVAREIIEEYKTDSGLLLSSQDVDAYRYKKGIVLKVGNNVEVIGENDMIYYDKAAGHKILLQDEPLTIIQERDVVVVL